MMDQEITSPKLLNNKFDFTNKGSLYHYYPGYSESFVRQIIEKYCSNKESSIILDPWNGSGTTTLVASVLGYKCYGYDINPIMVIVAKAKLHMPSRKEVQTLLQLLKSQLKSDKHIIDTELDPLSDWFNDDSIKVIRNFENVTLTYCDHKRNNSKESVGQFSNMTSFYYMAMFSVLKILTHKFSASNPTWIKLAKEKNELVICNENEIINLLKSYFENMFNSVKNTLIIDLQSSNIEIGDSRNIPLTNDSIDAIITSPPYCTRIDYAVYTRVELAYLRHDKSSLRDLRHKMVGTPTITSKNPANINSGNILVEYCNYLLDEIKGHYSKASESYYHKTYSQYFISLTNSVSEISRVLKTKGILAIVVQDSWFKDIHIDLQRVLIEICKSHRLILVNKYEFPSNTNMGYLNNNSKKYRPKLKAMESVLLFEKE